MNIKEVAIINHCFGEDTIVDGVNFNDIDSKDIQEWIFDKIKNMQQYDFIEIFKNIVWSSSLDQEDIYHNKCDKCGDWNSKTILKFIENEESK